MSSYSLNGIFTEEGIIFDENDGESVSGVCKTDDGLAIVDVKDGKLVGASKPNPDLTLDSYVAPFDYLSSVFVDEGNGVYTLPNVLGLYDYTEDINPVVAVLDEYPDSGSLKIEITGADSCVFTYQVTSEGSYQGMYDDIRIEITDIGTTQWPYSDEDYLPYTEPESWADIEDAVELLESYGIPTDVLPFYAPSGSMVAADCYNGAITITPPMGTDTASCLAEYQELLEEAGWTHVGQNGYGEEAYTYTLEDGTVLNIGVVDEGYGYVSIYLYEPTAPETALSRFFEENFSGYAPNYTMSGTVTYDYYATEGSSEQPVRTERTSFTQTYDADAAKQEVVKDGKTSVDVYRNTGEGLEVYSLQEDGTFARDDNPLYDSYTSYMSALYTLKDMDATAFDLQEDGTYKTTDYSALLDIVLAVNATDLPKVLKSATIALDETDKTMTFHLDAQSIVDEDGTEYRVELSYDFVIENIGTTTVDLSFLGK